MKRNRILPLLLAATLSLLTSCGQQDSDSLIAIDVLIQPGPKMMEEAERWNALMRQQYPDGFALDEEHAPHVTLVQRFIEKKDLPQVLAAVEKVKSEFNYSSLEMTATGLYHIPTGEYGLAGIVVEPSEELRALHEAIIEAINDYARTGGDESAFVPDRSGTPFDPYLFEYVETFVPPSGQHKSNPPEHPNTNYNPPRTLCTLRFATLIPHSFPQKPKLLIHRLHDLSYLLVVRN